MWDFPANPANGQTFVPPASSVTYTYNGYAWVTGPGAPSAPLDFVNVTGDTMTGFLTLNADPVNPLHAATKQYTDAKTLPAGGNVGEALVKNALNVPAWGANIIGANF